MANHHAMGIPFAVQLARITGTLVSRSLDLVAAGDRIFSAFECRFGEQLHMALDFGGNVPRDRMADSGHDLGRFDLDWATAPA